MQDRGWALQAGGGPCRQGQLVMPRPNWCLTTCSAPLKTITTMQDRGWALQAGSDSHILLRFVLDHLQCGTLSLMCKHAFLEQASVARHQLCTCSRDLQWLEVHVVSTTYSACQAAPVAHPVNKWAT